MIISSVVAICISLIMATSAIFVDKLTFTPPQFLMSRGSVNVSLSTKIADVAIIREIQIATTEDIIIPK